MQSSTVTDISVRELSSRFNGEVASPGDARYDDARAVWNAMVDKRPGVIARPLDAAGVAAAVDFAREHGLPVAVRCGGHSVAGKSACDDGLLIDLSLMKGVHVDPQRGTARANAGVLWGEYDTATQAAGLATPGGRVTTTGIGGPRERQASVIGGAAASAIPEAAMAAHERVTSSVSR
jgi:FAD/FMN-containing dehydrogenase